MAEKPSDRNGKSLTVQGFAGSYDPSAANVTTLLDEDPGDGGGTGGGSGSGYGSGGSSSGPSDVEKKAADNLTALKAWEVPNITMNAMDNGLAVLQTADEQNRAQAQAQDMMALRKANNEYFSNLLNEQSSYDALRQFMGNARLGSGALSLNQLMQRRHDATAASVIETREENLNNNALSLANALASNVNAANQLISDTETKVHEAYADYVESMNNINPALVDGSTEGYPSLIDSENKTLTENGPDWYKSNKDLYKTMARQPVRPELVTWTRPPAAVQQTVVNKIAPRSNATDNKRAANKAYWAELLTTDYGQRRR